MILRIGTRHRANSPSPSASVLWRWTAAGLRPRDGSLLRTTGHCGPHTGPRDANRHSGFGAQLTALARSFSPSARKFQIRSALLRLRGDQGGGRPAHEPTEKVGFLPTSIGWGTPLPPPGPARGPRGGTVPGQLGGCLRGSQGYSVSRTGGGLGGSGTHVCCAQVGWGETERPRGITSRSL